MRLSIMTMCCVIMLTLTGCMSKNVASCLEFVDGAGTVEINGGPIGEIGKVSMTGESRFVRIPKDYLGVHPCSGNPTALPPSEVES